MDMFEPQDHPNDFAYPGGPPKRPYDITGWTLAMQMGVQYDRVMRSEEHTSELQSPCNFVCRLLLEKNSTTLTPLPVAFCGGRIERGEPVPGLTAIAVRVKGWSGELSTSRAACWPTRR